MSLPQPQVEPLNQAVSRSMPRTWGALLWWAVLAGSIGQYFLIKLDLSFDGLSLLNTVVIPTVILARAGQTVVISSLPVRRVESVLFWLFVLCVTTSIGLRMGQILNDSGPGDVRAILVRPFMIISGYLLGQCIGRHSQLRNALFENRANTLLLISVFVAVLLAASESSFMRVGAGYVFSFADAMVYVAIGSLAPLLTERRWFSLGVGCLLVGGLFVLIGLRGAIAAFAVSSAVMILASVIKSTRQTPVRATRRRWGAWALFAGAVGAGLVMLTRYDVTYWLEQLWHSNSVIWRLSLGSDESFAQRSLLREYGLEVINSNVMHTLFGKFSYEYFEIGPGAYVHDILSVWAEYGVFAYMITIALAILAMFRIARWRLDHPGLVQIAWLFAYWGVSFLFFRTSFTVHFWLALGAVFGMSAQQEHTRESQT